MGLGNNLKYILKRNGKTLKWLSEETGISVNTLYSITRRDTERASIDTLNKISECLGIPANELIEDNFVSNKEIYLDLDKMILSKKFRKELSDAEKEKAFSILKNKGEERADEYLSSIYVEQRREYLNSEEIQSLTNSMSDLLNAFSKLNSKGRAEAVKRITEMTYLPEYKKFDSKEG